MIPLGLYGAARPVAADGGGFAYIGGGQFSDFGVTTIAKIQTLTAVPLGADFAGRQIAIAVMLATDSTAGDIGSVVVGGVTFTIDVTSGVNRYVVGVVRGVVAGTSADVVITAGASTNKASTHSAIAVYHLPSGVAPVTTAAGDGLAAVDLAVAAGEVAIVAQTHLSAQAYVFAAPVTTDYTNGTNIRLAGSIEDYSGTASLISTTAGAVAYNRIAGVTYA